jgi:pantetheine-phosphate adenylyltransferase
MSRIAVYAGTFDPPTNGHAWVIGEALILFDRVIVAVASNPAKKPRISALNRMALLRQMMQSVGRDGDVVVVDPTVYIADAAWAAGARYLVRGLRAADEFTYEQTLRDFNEERRGLTTVVLMPPPHLRGLSSSYVNALVGPKGWQDVVAKLVPASVLEYIERGAVK